MISVHPEASDNLLEALQGASIVEEHRILMGTVVERVQSAKSGVTEACTSLPTVLRYVKQLRKKNAVV